MLWFWLLYIVKWKGCAGGGLAGFCWACRVRDGLAYEPICASDCASFGCIPASDCRVVLEGRYANRNVTDLLLLELGSGGLAAMPGRWVCAINLRV